MPVIRSENLNCSQQNYFQLAAEMARRSPMKRRTGAVIVSRGQVISSGFNDYSRPYIIDPYGRRRAICSLHAEVSATMSLWGRERERSAKVAEEV